MDNFASADQPVPLPPAHLTVTTEGKRSSDSFDKSLGGSVKLLARLLELAIVSGSANVYPEEEIPVELPPEAEPAGRVTNIEDGAKSQESPAAPSLFPYCA